MEERRAALEAERRAQQRAEEEKLRAEAEKKRAAAAVARTRQRQRIAAVAFVVLLLFAIAMVFQSRRIARESDRANKEAESARQAADFLVGLFEESQPYENPAETTVRQVLDRGAKKIEAELDDQPVIQARLMATIGGVYVQLGVHGEARRLLENALQRQRELIGAEEPETLRTERHLGWLLSQAKG